MTACGEKPAGNSDNTSSSANGTEQTQETEYVFKERQIKADGQSNVISDVIYPDSLWQTPEYEYADDLNFGTEGVRGLFYTSPIKYNGKPTKIAAYIGFPEGASAENKVPAIVLVHGGLGTAIPDWVKYWNDLGFAAISMDTEGAEPINGVSNSNNLHKERNRYDGDENYSAGPTNAGFADYNKPLEDQWMYHATSAVILATSLISSFDCVDVQKIGTTGVSWGGMITSIVPGYDDRLSFSMPVYGALSLTKSCSGFATIYPDKIASDRWDKLTGLKKTNCKMFYVTSINDHAFSMDAASRCAQAANGFAVYKKLFPHGQDYGATEGNMPFFAKYFCGMESEFVEILTNPSRLDPTIKFRTYGDVTVNSVKIMYTDSAKPDKSASWESRNVKLVEGVTEYTLNVPESTYAYVQIKYNNNLEVSSYIF